MKIILLSLMVLFVSCKKEIHQTKVNFFAYPDMNNNYDLYIGNEFIQSFSSGIENNFDCEQRNKGVFTHEMERGTYEFKAIQCISKKEFTGVFKVSTKTGCVFVVINRR